MSIFIFLVDRVLELGPSCGTSRSLGSGSVSCATRPELEVPVVFYRPLYLLLVSAVISYK